MLCGEVFLFGLLGGGGDGLFHSLSLGKELPHLTGPFTLGYFFPHGMTSVAFNPNYQAIFPMTTDGDINGEAVGRSTVDSQELDIHQDFTQLCVGQRWPRCVRINLFAKIMNDNQQLLLGESGC